MRKNDPGVFLEILKEADMRKNDTGGISGNPHKSEPLVVRSKHGKMKAFVHFKELIGAI